MGPAEAPVVRLKSEFRYQLLIKSGSRKDLNALLRKARDFAREQKWNATALVIDVDPIDFDLGAAAKSPRVESPATPDLRMTIVDWTAMNRRVFLNRLPQRRFCQPLFRRIQMSF